MHRAGPLLLTLFLALLLALAGCRDRKPVVDDAALGTALQEAKARRAAVIVDFHAPWCYSCYYMARHVTTGAEWEAVRKRAVIVEQDADSPEGAALQQRLGVRALPTYVVLDAEGRELGRILGEQTREAFYRALDGMLDRGSALDTLAARVNGGDAASVVAAREVLASYHARYDAEGGLRWFAELPRSAYEAVGADGEAALWLARLRLLGAARSQNTQACVEAGRTVLAGELGCARAYELGRFLACAEKLEPERKRTLLAAQREETAALVEQGVFGTERCADERSVVLTAADLYAALDEREAQQALLLRAIDEVEARIGKNLKADRNLADNLRVYLEAYGELSGDYARFDALMPRLIAAWPEDYVYTYRHGRSLLARGHAEDALPLLEDAATKAYGANRLRVAEFRVQALQALDRAADARRVVAETLRANGPWFPEEAARLKAMVKSSG